jgi:predicted transcriptional regulator
MPTSVHIPKPLLEAVDRRARALKVSRNRLIVQALERELQEGTAWSPDFFARLAAPPADIASAVEEMEEAIRQGRGSKKPVRL